MHGNYLAENIDLDDIGWLFQFENVPAVLVILPYNLPAVAASSASRRFCRSAISASFAIRRCVILVNPSSIKRPEMETAFVLK